MHLFPLVVQSVLIRDDVCGGVWLRGVLNTLSTSHCLMHDCGLIGRCHCQPSLVRPITVLQSSPILYCQATEKHWYAFHELDCPVFQAAHEPVSLLFKRNVIYEMPTLQSNTQVCLPNMEI